MNALQEARYRATRSWRTARDGTKRTAGWVTGGVGGAFRKTGGAIARPGIVARIRSHPRVAVAWAAAALLVIAWIGWTVHIWIENGAGAGIGVLVSWPAVLAALALVASPFVGAGVLVRRHRVAADGPAVAETAEVEAAHSPDVDSDQNTAADDEEKADGDEAPPSDEPEPEEEGREPDKGEGD